MGPCGTRHRQALHHRTMASRSSSVLCNCPSSCPAGAPWNLRSMQPRRLQQSTASRTLTRRRARPPQQGPPQRKQRAGCAAQGAAPHDLRALHAPSLFRMPPGGPPGGMAAGRVRRGGRPGASSSGSDCGTGGGGDDDSSAPSDPDEDERGYAWPRTPLATSLFKNAQKPV